MARRPKPRMDDRSSMTVQHMAREARSLVSIRPESGWDRAQVEGAIVRMYPPATATAAEIEGYEQALLEHGAVVVKTMPRPKADRVMVPGFEGKPTPAVATVREVVEAMIRDANTEDREALAEVVGAVLDAKGL